MGDRPYTVLSCGMSIDGYIEDPDVHRLALSNAADFDRVDEVRAGVDAILVGAATVRNDDPRLLVRSADRRSARKARGLPFSPMKVTVTASGRLDPSKTFFADDGARKLVYCPPAALPRLRSRLGHRADAAAFRAGMAEVAADLGARGVGRLLVEGGQTVHTQFLENGLADELQLVVAPVFVGDGRARRFVGEAAFPWNPARRADLAEVRRIGDVALLRYALSPRFEGERTGSAGSLARA